MVDSLANELLSAAKRSPHAGVLFVSDTDEAELLTYPALLEEARCILGGLQACGVRPRAHVALLLERPRDFIPTFWACALGGYVPCPVIRRDPPSWFEHTVDASRLERLRMGKSAALTFDAGPDDPALLMLMPAAAVRAVALTYANLAASLAAKAAQLKLTGADVMLNWVPFDHGAALLETHLLAMHLGAMQVHAQPAAVFRDPLRFLAWIDRYRVTMTFARHTLFAQMNAAMAAGASVSLDLSCVRHIVSGGEPVVVETACRLLERLGPHGLARGVLRPAFGRPEIGAGGIYSHDFPECDAGREFASLGRPLPGLEMRIAEDGSHELELRGPMVFGGYHGDPEATRAAFTEDGWFRTRTQGRIDEGRLSLVDPTKFE